MSLEPIFMPSDRSRPDITVRPEPQAEPKAETALSTESAPRWKGSTQKATLGDGKAFTAGDFLDLINPLQHLPVVGDVYRAITGDTISQEAKVLGGALFGGPVGLAAATVDAMIQHESGGSIADHAVALAGGPAVNPAQPAPIQLAEAPRRPIITPPVTLPPAPTRAEAPRGDEPYVIDDNNIHPAAAIAPGLPPALTPAEQQKHDAILDLFGAGVSSLREELSTHNALLYAQEAQLGLGA